MKLVHMGHAWFLCCGTRYSSTRNQKTYVCRRCGKLLKPRARLDPDNVASLRFTISLGSAVARRRPGIADRPSARVPELAARVVQGEPARVVARVRHGRCTLTRMNPIEAALANLAAEADYLEALASFPAIVAERRRILEETERDLARAVADQLGGEASGRPAGRSGFPDDQIGDQS